MLGKSRRLAFEQAAQRYVDFYLAHMALGEREQPVTPPLDDHALAHLAGKAASASTADLPV